MICLHLVIHAFLFSIDDPELDRRLQTEVIHVYIVVCNMYGVTFLSSHDIEPPSKFKVVSYLRSVDTRTSFVMIQTFHLRQDVDIPNAIR